MTPYVVVFVAKVAGTIVVLAAMTVGSAIASHMVANRFVRGPRGRRAIHAAVAMSGLLSLAGTTWLLLHST